MPVDTQHPEYIKASERWATMRDVIAGEDEIKTKGVKYLPGFIPDDPTRYEAYKLRANFVRYTGRTASGLNGAIFRKSPDIKLPSTLDYMREDADGAGQGLEQLAKELGREEFATGRAGLLLDRPISTPGATREDDLKSNLRSNLSLYEAETILNWKTAKHGGATTVTMVVLLESVETKKDEFQTEKKPQFRVLALDGDGNYYQQIYNDKKEPQEAIYPKKSDGSLWNRIPFEFVGAENNKVDVDDSPLYGMAKVNIAQYRNSADYEEGVHMLGQPTLFIDPGKMTADAFVKANPNGVVVGSRRGIVLGEGGEPFLMSMEANGAAYEAMGQKEGQMIAIGAKIVQSAGKNQTAEEARINASAEHSVLNTIVGNMDDAIESLLKLATEFEGGSPEEVEFSLNRQFFPDTITAQEATALVMLADRGDIAQSDIRAKLRKTEWLEAGRTDEDIDNELEGNPGI